MAGTAPEQSRSVKNDLELLQVIVCLPEERRHPECANDCCKAHGVPSLVEHAHALSASPSSAACLPLSLQNIMLATAATAGGILTQRSSLWG